MKRDMKDSGSLGRLQEMRISGRKPRGRLQKSWKVVDENLEELGADEENGARSKTMKKWFWCRSNPG